MDVEVEQPHAHVAAHKTGHAWLDKVLPVSALFVSFISILIAWHHGEVMQELVEQNRRLVQANSLPYLSFGRAFTRTDAGNEVRLSLQNNGVGPGEIRWAEARLDGRPVARLTDLLQSCCGLKDAKTTASLSGRMISPQTSFDFLVLQPTAETRAGVDRFSQLSMSDRIEMRICYCSVFDECWAIRTSGEERPMRVKQCPPTPTLRV
jgi:hypothetical protein